LIVVDASTIVGAALKPGSVPWRALMQALARDRLAMSQPVADEIRSVLERPKFALVLTPSERTNIAALLFADASWFHPSVSVTDCRDPKDNIYLELALAAEAATIVSSDNDLLSLDPWRGVRILRPAGYLAEE
jgi:uncharacterized protein